MMLNEPVEMELIICDVFAKGKNTPPGNKCVIGRILYLKTLTHNYMSVVLLV